MLPQVQYVLEKLKHLSPDRLEEVEDFIDFLQQRDQDNCLLQDFSDASASAAASANVWDDDDDDAIYNTLMLR